MVFLFLIMDIRQDGFDWDFWRTCSLRNEVTIAISFFYYVKLLAKHIT